MCLVFNCARKAVIVILLFYNGIKVILLLQRTSELCR